LKLASTSKSTPSPPISSSLVRSLRSSFKYSAIGRSSSFANRLLAARNAKGRWPHNLASSSAWSPILLAILSKRAHASGDGIILRSFSINPGRVNFSREVTIRPHEEGGSNGRTCSSLAALSSKIRAFLLCSFERYNPLSLDSLAGK